MVQVSGAELERAAARQAELEHELSVARSDYSIMLERWREVSAENDKLKRELDAALANVRMLTKGEG